MTLSSTLMLDSSRGCALVLPGDRGVTAVWGRVNRRGASIPDGLSVIALSNALGRSWAPGGIVFLLGLPWGVLGGFRNALLLLPFLTGVLGRAEASLDDLSLPPGKKLAMKLAIAADALAKALATLG